MSELQEIGPNDRLGDYARGRDDERKAIAAWARAVSERIEEEFNPIGKQDWSDFAQGVEAGHYLSKSEGTKNNSRIATELP